MADTEMRVESTATMSISPTGPSHIPLSLSQSRHSHLSPTPATSQVTSLLCGVGIGLGIAIGVQVARRLVSMVVCSSTSESKSDSVSCSLSKSNAIENENALANPEDQGASRPNISLDTDGGCGKQENIRNSIELSPLRLSSSSQEDFRPIAPVANIQDVKVQSTQNRADVDPYSPLPRANYLSWDDYFMSVAFLSAQRSKDPNKQVGACIVSPDKIILGIGYNGFPRGCSDQKLPWAKRSATDNKLETKYPYVCHAEMNAIINKNSTSLSNSTIYVTMFPCNECAKLLIQAGIREVVFYEDKRARPETPVHGNGSTPKRGRIKPSPGYKASASLLDMANIKLRQHRPTRKVWIDFY